MTDTEVKINGKSAGPVHQGAFYRFKYDISDLLNYKGKNLLEVTVSKESANESVNRAERISDFWVFGGIFRPVYLEAFPQQYIDRVAIDARADGSFYMDVYTGGKGKAKHKSQLQTTDGKNYGAEMNAAVNNDVTGKSVIKGSFEMPCSVESGISKHVSGCCNINEGKKSVHQIDSEIWFPDC